MKESLYKEVESLLKHVLALELSDATKHINYSDVMITLNIKSTATTVQLICFYNSDKVCDTTVDKRLFQTQFKTYYNDFIKNVVAKIVETRNERREDLMKYLENSFNTFVKTSDSLGEDPLILFRSLLANSK